MLAKRCTRQTLQRTIRYSSLLALGAADCGFQSPIGISPIQRHVQLLNPGCCCQLVLCVSTHPPILSRLFFVVPGVRFTSSTKQTAAMLWRSAFEPTPRRPESFRRCGLGARGALRVDVGRVGFTSAKHPEVALLRFMNFQLFGKTFSR